MWTEVLGVQNECANWIQSHPMNDKDFFRHLGSWKNFEQKTKKNCECVHAEAPFIVLNRTEWQKEPCAE